MDRPKNNVKFVCSDYLKTLVIRLRIMLTRTIKFKESDSGKYLFCACKSSFFTV